MLWNHDAGCYFCNCYKLIEWLWANCPIEASLSLSSKRMNQVRLSFESILPLRYYQHNRTLIRFCPSFCYPGLYFLESQYFRIWFVSCIVLKSITASFRVIQFQLSAFPDGIISSWEVLIYWPPTCTGYINQRWIYKHIFNKKKCIGMTLTKGLCRERMSLWTWLAFVECSFQFNSILLYLLLYFWSWGFFHGLDSALKKKCFELWKNVIIFMKLLSIIISF